MKGRETKRTGQIVKITVEDLHELEWTEGQSLKDMPKACVDFIGEVVEDNESYIILRNSRFHDNPFSLPLKNVGVYLPKSMIIETEEMKSNDR